MIKQFDNIVLSADLTYLFSCLKFPEVKSIREYEEEALKPFVWFVCLFLFFLFLSKIFFIENLLIINNYRIAHIDNYAKTINAPSFN